MDELDRSILDAEARLAARLTRAAGARENAAAELGLSPTRYAQRLNRLLDDVDAWAYAPVLVKRLRRVREKRVA